MILPFQKRLPFGSQTVFLRGTIRRIRLSCFYVAIIQCNVQVMVTEICSITYSHKITQKRRTHFSIHNLQ